MTAKELQATELSLLKQLGVVPSRVFELLSDHLPSQDGSLASMPILTQEKQQRAELLRSALDESISTLEKNESKEKEVDGKGYSPSKAAEIKEVLAQLMSVQSYIRE